MATSLNDLVSYSDKMLSHETIQDYPGALNGLQLQNNGNISRIAAAVDGNFLTVKQAISEKADLLILHHGIGWSPLCPIIGNKYKMLKLAMDHNLAIYSSHLPLDAHSKLGNNIQLTQALGFKKSSPFFEEKGTYLGRKVKTKIKRNNLVERLTQVLGAKPILISGGPKSISTIGIVTGGAGNQLAHAHAEGVDTFITGEGNQWTFSAAHELGINVIYGGHYLTETFGVKALAQHLSKKYKLPWNFIDVPTGL